MLRRVSSDQSKVLGLNIFKTASLSSQRLVHQSNLWPSLQLFTGSLITEALNRFPSTNHQIEVIL
ncbi:hypothetical protein QWZ13_06380 [Reinekea marina]|uniref:hypothetical protein n=1 Tax=Reinekea marina TaxID=1310421 RepID=UPI0025B2D845|nr:hypothetical protein [Reinekea marina]MDN3648535.1 hypothetical protein [Reinekea marina]